MRRFARRWTGFALLKTRRSQVQILSPLPTSQFRGPPAFGEGLLLCDPSPRSVARSPTSKSQSSPPSQTESRLRIRLALTAA